MDLLIALLAHYQAGTTNPAALRLADAVHTGAWSVPAALGLCAAAGVASAGAAARRLQPVPAAGQVWVARRRDLRGIRVRITDTAAVPTAVVLTPPPGPLAAEIVGAPVHLPARGRRVPGFRLLAETAHPTTHGR